MVLKHSYSILRNQYQKIYVKNVVSEMSYITGKIFNNIHLLVCMF